jgi:hypothetical protein
MDLKVDVFKGRGWTTITFTTMNDKGEVQSTEVKKVRNKVMELRVAIELAEERGAKDMKWTEVSWGGIWEGRGTC